jgi:AIG2 family protein
MVSTLIGLATGLFLSLVAWWLVARAVTPKLALSREISRLQDLSQPRRPRYRIKIVNLRRWPLPHSPAVEVRVVSSLRLKGLEGYEHWTDFPIPIAHSGEMDMIERNALPRLRLFDIRPDHLKRLVAGHANDSDPRDVELEHLLRLGTASEVRVVVSAAHPYTGARRSVTQRYTLPDVVRGSFWKRPGKEGLRVARPHAGRQQRAGDAEARGPLASQASEHVLLFQYGSNMSERRLAAAIQRHARFAPPETPLGLRLVGNARLRGWSFAFDLFSATQESLVADIIEGDEVWGALYELNRELVVRADGGRSVLDRIEGRRTERDPENYALIDVVVDAHGSPQSALVYVGTDEARERCRTYRPNARPSSEYVRSILEGAAAADLPVHYVQHLKELAEGYQSVASNEH